MDASKESSMIAEASGAPVGGGGNGAEERPASVPPRPVAARGTSKFSAVAKREQASLTITTHHAILGEAIARDAGSVGRQAIPWQRDAFTAVQLCLGGVLA